MSVSGLLRAWLITSGPVVIHATANRSGLWYILYKQINKNQTVAKEGKEMFIALLSFVIAVMAFSLILTLVTQENRLGQSWSEPIVFLDKAVEPAREVRRFEK
jgi:hypothetical protein